MIYNEREIAAKAAAILRNKGNPARVVTEPQSEPHRENPVFILQTPFEERAQAIQSIEKSFDTEPDLEREAIHCPQCNSTTVEFPNEPQASPSMKAFAKFSDFLDRIFGVEKNHKFHCIHCDKTWSKKR